MGYVKFVKDHDPIPEFEVSLHLWIPVIEVYLSVECRFFGVMLLGFGLEWHWHPPAEKEE